MKEWNLSVSDLVRRGADALNRIIAAPYSNPPLQCTTILEVRWPVKLKRRLESNKEREWRAWQGTELGSAKPFGSG